MARSLIRPVVLVLVGTTVAVAQSRLTTADYDRASRMLAPALNGLVVGGTANVTWLPDGRFSYQRTSLAGTDNVVVDPVKKTREVVATPSASGQTPPVEGAGRGGGRGAGRGGRGNMAITNKTCGPNVTGMPGNPASMSPDGTRAIFICDWNLWVRDAATGQDRRLTTDGEKDFGYAPSNAGWTTSSAASLSWSPDGKKVATQ